MASQSCRTSGGPAFRARIGLQRTDQTTYIINIVATHVVDQTSVNSLAYQRVIEQRGANAYGTGAGNQELQSILRATDPSLPDDWNRMRARHLVNLMDFEQGHRLYRGSRQSSLIGANDGATLFNIDGHAHEGVHNRQGVSPGFDTASRILGNVGLIW